MKNGQYGNYGAGPAAVLSWSHLLHGVQKLSELIEPLPVLAGVLVPFDDGFAQFFNVGQADFIKHSLALQPILWYCSDQRYRTQWCHITSRPNISLLHLYGPVSLLRNQRKENNHWNLRSDMIWLRTRYQMNSFWPLTRVCLYKIHIKIRRTGVGEERGRAPFLPVKADVILWNKTKKSLFL